MNKECASVIIPRFDNAASNISRTINQTENRDHTGRQPERERMSTSKARQSIKKGLQQNSRISMLKIAKEKGGSREMTRPNARKYFKNRPYKLQNAQLYSNGIFRR